MRGWRPSRFAPSRELLEDSDGTKEANMFRYEMRARRGVPLFEVAEGKDRSQSANASDEA